MAYSIDNLIPVAGNGKRGNAPMLYAFWNEAGDTVTTAGYFANKALSVGDQIEVIADDYTTSVKYRVSAVANGAATVVAYV